MLHVFIDTNNTAFTFILQVTGIYRYVIFKFPRNVMNIGIFLPEKKVQTTTKIVGSHKWNKNCICAIDVRFFFRFERWLFPMRTFNVQMRERKKGEWKNTENMGKRKAIAIIMHEHDFQCANIRNSSTHLFIMHTVLWSLRRIV